MKTADIVHRGRTARRNNLRCSPRGHHLGAVYCVLQAVSLKSDRFVVPVHRARVACRVVDVFGCANSPPTQSCMEPLRSPVAEKEHPWNHPLHSACTERVRKAILFAALAKSAHQAADVSCHQSPSFSEVCNVIAVTLADVLNASDFPFRRVAPVIGRHLRSTPTRGSDSVLQCDVRGRPAHETW